MPDTAQIVQTPAADAQPEQIQLQKIPSKKEQRQQRREERDAMLRTLVAKVAGLEHQIPEIGRRIASEQPVSKSESKGDVQAQLDALRQEIDKRDQVIAREKRANAVRAAVSAIPWFNPEDAVRELLPVAQERDGRLFVQASEKVGSVDVSKELTLEEAVRGLAKAKPYLIKASLSGGSGASGDALGGSAPSMLKGQITKWRQVKDDPVLLSRLQAEDPEYAEKLQQKYIVKQRSRNAGQ